MAREGDDVTRGLSCRLFSCLVNDQRSTKPRAPHPGIGLLVAVCSILESTWRLHIMSLLLAWVRVLALSRFFPYLWPSALNSAASDYLTYSTPVYLLNTAIR